MSDGVTSRLTTLLRDLELQVGDEPPTGDRTLREWALILRLAVSDVEDAAIKHEDMMLTRHRLLKLMTACALWALDAEKGVVR